MLKLSKILGISISELYECVEENDTEKTEEYSEERVWQYKKYSIASYFLVILSPALFLLTAVKWTSFYDLEDIFNFTLTIGAMASFIIGLLFQVTGFVRLYSYSKTKFYQSEYKRVLRKYGIIFLICLAAVLLFPLTLFIISFLIP